MKNILPYLLLILFAAPLCGQSQINWKKDHIYAGPGGKEIATMTPAPSDATAPTAPSGLAVTASTATSVTLGWTGSADTGGSGLAGYKIYRGNLPVGTTAPGVVAFIDRPLTPNTAYIYSVLAFDAAQNHSAASNTVNPATPAATGETAAPEVPANPRGRALSHTSIRAEWNASTDSGGSGMAGYRVYRGGALVSGPNPVAGLSFDDTGLTANTAYSYTVRATDNAGNTSIDSAVANVTTKRETAYSDDFNRPDETGSGNYYVRSNTLDLVTPLTLYWWYDRVPTTAQTDFKASVQVLHNPYGYAGLWFWGDTYSSRYRAVLAGSSLYLYFYDWQNNPALVSSAGGIASGSCSLTVEATSGTRRIKIYHNGVLKIDFTETDTSRPNTGKIGLTAQQVVSQSLDVLFDDFLVEK